VRGCIIAPPGKKLVVADLANIEGRNGAWLAGEEWKLDAFRAYDTSHGPDLYVMAYATAFNIDPEDVEKWQRQIGKVMELMLLYAGGVGAFVTGAETYGIDLDDLARRAAPLIPPRIRKEAEDMWKWCHDPKHKMRRRFICGLAFEVFVVLDSLKRLWREGHPMVVSLWTDIEDAIRHAIARPGITIECRMFKLRVDGAWLRIRLPSGNYLCYPSPRVADDGAISYMGMNQYTKQWQRIGTYGGKVLENASQGIAGDVLKAAMPEAEDAGYEFVLTVHDEGVTETPDSKIFSGAALAGMLAKQRSWTTGLPLAAAGSEMYRYHKED
jgi:DNA polymerase